MELGCGVQLPLSTTTVGHFELTDQITRSLDSGGVHVPDGLLVAHSL